MLFSEAIKKRNGASGVINIARNGYGFVQDGHSYSVAGLAGHR